MAAKLEYQIVGRYMSGNEIVGYHLHCLSNGKSGMYTKEQVAFLVGRNQVTNCQGQIYKDKVLLRGIGISLDSLPTKMVNQENSGIKNADSLGKIRKGTSDSDAMSQVMVIRTIVSGRNVIGYVVQNAGGGTANIPRAKMLELAKAGRIGNVRYQESNGKPILRGVGINLNEIPTVTAESLGIKVAN